MNFNIWVSISFLSLIAISSSPARPPLHTVLLTTSSNVAGGSALYVGVDRTEFGSMTTTGAVRMFNSGGNTWNGRIAIQGSATDTNALIRYTARTTSSATHCTLGNGNLSGSGFSTNLPLWNPGYIGKTVYYHTSWTNAFILYRQGETDTFIDVPMTRLGNGRAPGEFLYQATGISEAGRPIEFVLHGQNLSGVMQWDNPAVGGIGNPANYYTFIDTFFVQDGNIYNYFPPATVSAPQVINVTSWPSSYTGNGIPTRGGRIYLPRGYAQNTTKKYPVLYMHDGQNVFDPGGAFGSWSADAAATREITQGRMRETIIVAVNNSNSRMSEYGTPQDGYTGNFYMQYLVNNVKPNIDATYRTLTNMMDTGNMGSSLGGLISAYIGLSTNVFGLVGAVSPSYWYGPNFRGWINTQPTKGRRIYQDAGTSEGSSMWDHFWPVYTYYLQDDYVVNDDLMVAIGCGQGHNEAAWAARIPGAFRYLYNPWDEANLLETNAAPSPGTFQFTETGLSIPETGGTARVYVSRLGGSSGAAGVIYSTSNATAIAGTDFSATAGELVWTNNDASTKYIDVVIHDDNFHKGDRFFMAMLTSATGASLGSPVITTITIIEDDPMPPDLIITNPLTDIVVGETVETFDLKGEANPFRWTTIAWTNHLSGASGEIDADYEWSIENISLSVGANQIDVIATNIWTTRLTNSADDGSSAVYSDGWADTDNGGFGFGNWQLFVSSNNVNVNGRFMATNAAVNIGTPAWGLYANSTNLSEAKRVLTSALNTNQVFQVSLDNGFIDNDRSIGVALQNENGENLWQFYFIGGELYYRISGGTTDIGWTSSGIEIEFALTGPTNYQAIITPFGDTARTNTGNLLPVSNSSILLFRAWNFSAGAGSDYDMFFNNLKIIDKIAESVSTSATVTITRPAPALHDGIPLSWWNQYGMGTNSLAAGDDDGDGTTNWEEFIADTNPTNPASVFTNRILNANGEAVLSIQVGPPTTNSRVYDVWFGTNLIHGDWNPLNLDTLGAADGHAILITVTNLGDVGVYRTGVKLP